MSQNATLRNRGQDKGPSKMSHTDSQKHHNKHTSTLKTSSNVDENHTTNKSENSHVTQQVAPTAEQLRLAHLMGGNKADDPEINKKIKQVLDIVPNRNHDEILMILHEYDYDVAKVIEYLLDGGEDLTHDWKTAGKQNKKQTVSPNQSLEETDLKNGQHQKSNQRNHKTDTNGHSNNNERNAKSNRNDKNNRKFEKNSNRKNENNDNNGSLDEKLNGMKLQDNDTNQNNHVGQSEHQERQYNNNNNKRGNMRGNTRGGRGGGVGRGGRTGVAGDRGSDRFNGERQNNRGGRSQGNRKERQPRNEEELRPNDETDIKNNLNLENMNPLLETKTTNNASKELENNLRDIGTWSNEQAAPEPYNRRSNKSNHNITGRQQGNNRFQNNKNFNNQNNDTSKQNDDLDNEEEWQGDLSQTQVFTASNLPKDEAKRIDSDFPIGHFNTEEAAQKIKSAIGIVSSMSAAKPDSLEKTNKTNNINKKSTETVNNNKLEEKPVSTQSIKLGSIKPPPPSTKIPKSAVIMPGGGNTNTVNLDFSFGVDLEIPKTKTETVQKEQINQIQKPMSVSQPTAPIAAKSPVTSQQQQSQVQAPLPQRQQESIGSISSLNAYDSVNKALNSDAQQQKIGVVNPVVVNKVNKDTILNNLPLETDSVSSVLASLPKVELNLSGPPTSAQQSYINQQNQKQQSDAKSKSPQENNFISDTQKQQKQYMQFQNQIQQQNQLGMQSKGFNDQSSKSVQAQQSSASSSTRLNQLNQDVSASVSLNNMNNNQNNYQHQLNAINNNGNQSMKTSNSSQNINTSQSSSSQLLNQISPQNSTQKQLGNQSSSINSTSVSVSNTSTGKQTNNNGISNVNSTMPPPPGVNMVNPNNQFMMGLPFQQQFPYFDPSQMDANNIMQMYNHLAGVAPPGVGSATGTGGATPGAPYSMNDSKFNRSQDSTGSNSQLNPNAQLSQQQQQQQPMNMIPGLSNFPFFFHNYYPNMFMSMPQSGPQQQAPQQPQQQQNPQQFQNKQPYNFNNNTSGGTGNGVNDYEVQSKDYNNYNPQSQMKSSGSNLNSDITGYQKNVDKSNPGYHTPPPNYSNSLMNQQQPHPNAGSSGAPLPPGQYAYMNTMVGTPGGNPLVNQHGMQQENMNSRGLGNNGSSSIKQLQKTANYQNSPWS